MVSYNILYAQSFIHYVNFYVNLVVRSLQQRRGWGEKKKKILKIEKTIFWVIIIFQEVYTRTRGAGERKRGENDENGEQIFW